MILLYTVFIVLLKVRTSDEFHGERRMLIVMSHSGDREEKNPVYIRRTEKKYDCACIDLRSLRKQSRHRVNSRGGPWCLAVLQGLKKMYRLLQSFRTAASVTMASDGDRIRNYFVWSFGVVVFVIAVLQSCFS